MNSLFDDFYDKEPKEIIVYTDGACLGNPGPGGYGAVILQNGKEIKLSEGYKLTTNNRMEILAAIKALEYFGNTSYKVKLHSDSNLLVAAHNDGWIRNWLRNNWKKSNKSPVLNKDLWLQIIELDKKHKVEYIWVKGHANNHYNEMCDVLSKKAAENDNLHVDQGYLDSL